MLCQSGRKLSQNSIQNPTYASSHVQDESSLNKVSHLARKISDTSVDTVNENEGNAYRFIDILVLCPYFYCCHARIASNTS